MSDGTLATLSRRLRRRASSCENYEARIPLDRNAKVRLMHRARCLSRKTEKGKAYGAVTAKALAVLDALLWGFHNASSGRCFPSYEKIAEVARCARSTVREAIHQLEAARLLTWMRRWRRVWEDGRIRILRTSNGYRFFDPKPSKADFRPGTSQQEILIPKQEADDLGNYALQAFERAAIKRKGQSD